METLRIRRKKLMTYEITQIATLTNALKEVEEYNVIMDTAIQSINKRFIKNKYIFFLMPIFDRIKFYYVYI